MEKSRRRIRLCLIFVVLLAVVLGCVYYFGEMRKERNIEEGTLVKCETGGSGIGCEQGYVVY